MPLPYFERQSKRRKDRLVFQQVPAAVMPYKACAAHSYHVNSTTAAPRSQLKPSFQPRRRTEIVAKSDDDLTKAQNLGVHFHSLSTGCIGSEQLRQSLRL